MASRALTASARRTSLARESGKHTTVPSRDWRQVLTSQDASAIWLKILKLAQSIDISNEAAAQRCQDVFLGLLASDRFHRYEEECWRDEDINRDILGLLKKPPDT